MPDRSSERFPLVLEVHYHTVADFLIDYSENISKDGIFVKSDTPLPVNSVVELQIHLPDSGPVLEVAGRVVHVMDASAARATGRTAGIGIHLEEFAGTSREELNVYFKLLKNG